ncbi:alcohol dehydrogenase class-3 chain L-like [Tubulanus polymorphus]|uniref:alcohol dehydrogenase class-3 chain L-like n=1 Tax=Tubulanus polymorphus TaxID=672921 RepID=UPI003DA47D1C
MSSTQNKSISCKAAVCWKIGELKIETIQVAPPKTGEVRVKVVATGVCHSDAFSNSPRDSAPLLPRILGHEGAGIVESVGEGVTNVKPGDHVLMTLLPQCDDCRICKSKGNYVCERVNGGFGSGFMPDGTSRFSCNGKSLYNFLGLSTFTEYTVVSKLKVFKLADNVPFDKVCLLACGVATGFGSATNAAGVQVGDNCAVWGLGAVGLAAVMGCRYAGAKRIIGIDIVCEKAEMGKVFGLTDFINPLELDRPIEEVIKEMTDGGLDYAFECCGNIKTLEASFKCIHQSFGTVIQVGLTPDGSTLNIDPSLFRAGRRWRGACYGGLKSMDDIPKLVDLYMSKSGVLLDEFVTHTMPLERIQEAFDLMEQGKSIRSVIIMAPQQEK